MQKTVSSKLVFEKKRKINCRTSSRKGLNESKNALFLLYEERDSLVSGKKNLYLYQSPQEPFMRT